MHTLLGKVLKVSDTRRNVILAGGLNHPFPCRHLPPGPCMQERDLYSQASTKITAIEKNQIITDFNTISSRRNL